MVKIENKDRDTAIKIFTKQHTRKATDIAGFRIVDSEGVKNMHDYKMKFMELEFLYIVKCEMYKATIDYLTSLEDSHPLINAPNAYSMNLVTMPNGTITIRLSLNSQLVTMHRTDIIDNITNNFITQIYDKNPNIDEAITNIIKKMHGAFDDASFHSFFGDSDYLRNLVYNKMIQMRMSVLCVGMCKESVFISY